MSVCYKRLCPHVRQHIALLFFIILWPEQKRVAGNIKKNSTVYCLIIVGSCFVLILKFYIFSMVTHSSRTVWRMATLPMSCYIVRKSTTKRVPLCYTCYPRASQSRVALLFHGSTEIPFCTSSKLWYLRIGTTNDIP